MPNPQKLGSLHEHNGHWTLLSSQVRTPSGIVRDLAPVPAGEVPSSMPEPVARLKMAKINVDNFYGNLWRWNDGTVALIGPQKKRSDGSWFRPVRALPEIGPVPELVGHIEGKTGNLDKAKDLVSPAKRHDFQSHGDHRVIVNANPTHKVAFLIHGNNQTATSWIPGEADAQPGKVAFCEELLSLGYDIIALKSEDEAFNMTEIGEIPYMLELCEVFMARLPAVKTEVLGFGFSAGCAPAHMIASHFADQMDKVGATVFGARGARRAFWETPGLWSFWGMATNDKIVPVESVRSQIDEINTSWPQSVIEYVEKTISYPAHRVGEEWLPEWRDWYARWQSA